MMAAVLKPDAKPRTSEGHLTLVERRSARDADAAERVDRPHAGGAPNDVRMACPQLEQFAGEERQRQAMLAAITVTWRAVRDSCRPNPVVLPFPTRPQGCGYTAEITGRNKPRTRPPAEPAL
jgi:hypothetical protein